MELFLSLVPDRIGTEIMFNEFLKIPFEPILILPPICNVGDKEESGDIPDVVFVGLGVEGSWEKPTSCTIIIFHPM